jgi:hypothetical protein
MDYTVYHNNHPVCAVALDEDYRIEKVRKIYEEEHLPLGLHRGGGISGYDINNWFFGRAIPEKRAGLESILEKERVESNRELLVRNLGLSLSDHYWIKEEKEQREWNDVNFFENSFGERGSDIYIGEEGDIEGGDLTPNGASSGMLPKKWVIRDGKRLLLKGSEGIFNQEPFNEVIAAQFLSMMEVPHLKYELAWYKNKPYSLCACMVDNETELVQAYYVNGIKKRENAVSHFDHYIQCCMNAGLPESIRGELEKMIVMDYLMANTDRHWMNFGIIRKAETLEAVGLAPLFDNGASFYTKVHDRRIAAANTYLPCRSFKGNQEDNLALVGSLAWLEGKPVRKLPDVIGEGLQKNGDVGLERVYAIQQGITERIRMLERNRGIVLRMGDDTGSDMKKGRAI